MKLAAIQSVALILFGTVWIFTTIAQGKIDLYRTVAAVGAESELEEWTQKKVKEKKLTQEDYLELFPTDRETQPTEPEYRTAKEIIQSVAPNNDRNEIVSIGIGFIAVALGAWRFLPQKED